MCGVWVCVGTCTFQSFAGNGNLILLYQKDLVKLKGNFLYLWSVTTI